MTRWHDLLEKYGKPTPWPYPVRYDKEQEIETDQFDPGRLQDRDGSGEMRRPEGDGVVGMERQGVFVDLDQGEVLCRAGLSGKTKPEIAPGILQCGELAALVEQFGAQRDQNRQRAR